MPANYDSDTLTFRDLFGASVAIIVPRYQRSYSWDKENVEALWDDLITNWGGENDLNPNDDPYFLGTIVTVSGAIAKPSLLLDGQQRLASITLILCAIRDRLRQMKTDAAIEEASRIDKVLIEARSGPQKFVLTLNHEDELFFRQAIQAPSGVKPEPRLRSHKRILRAKTVSDKRIRELIRNRDNDAALQLLSGLWQGIAENIYVVNVTVKDEDDAGRVFEVLNDRGLALSVADLMRNFLISGAPSDQREDVGRTWDDLINQFKGADLSGFLRHSWVSRYNDISKKNAYTSIRAGLKDREMASLGYLNLLQQDAAPYTLLTNIDAGAKTDTHRADLIFGLNALRARQSLPLLIAVQETFEKELNQTLQRVNALTMQYSISERNPNQLEGVYSDLARKVRALGEASQQQVADLILAELTQRQVPSQEFENAFKNASIDSSALQRYILWELEKRIGPQGSLKEYTLADPTSVHVEHIYPQNPKPDKKWAEHDDIIDRIGNLTLLAGGINREILNSEFAEKKPHFAASSIEMTKALHSYSTWSPTEVEQRQIAFAVLAKDIWRVK